jgi:hypothetical protein
MTQMVSETPAQPVGPRPSPAYSLLTASPSFIVLAVAIGCVASLADPDLWIHILVGQRIVHTGHIPMQDLYSYSAAGLPWHNHEWLAEVVLGMSYQWFGVIGLRIVKLLCMAVLVSALAVGLSRAAAPPPVQRIVLLASAAALMMQMQFRPQLFTFALLSILMAKLAAEVYSGPVRLWPLIPMFALWANLHAGFAIGLAALSISSVILGLQEFRAKRTLNRARVIGAVTVGCAIATLFNPFGRDVWTTFMGSLSDPLIRPIITDWLPLVKFLTMSRYQTVLGVMPFLLFAAFMGSLFAAPAMDDAALVAVALVLIVAAFYANRNVALAVIALTIPLARHLGLVLQRHGFAGHGHDPAPAGPNPIFVMLAAAIFALAGGEFSNQLKTWEPVPSGAVAFMNKHGLRGNILNNIDWGEYLIWHGYPQSRVFIDGRYELVYPDSLIREYLGFHFGVPGGEKVLDGYPNDFVLIKPGTGAYRLVAADSRWRLIYRDSVAALFGKASGGVYEPVDNMMSGNGERSFFP